MDQQPEACYPFGQRPVRESKPLTIEQNKEYNRVLQKIPNPSLMNPTEQMEQKHGD